MKRLLKISSLIIGIGFLIITGTGCSDSTSETLPAPKAEEVCSDCKSPLSPPSGVDYDDGYERDSARLTQYMKSSEFVCESGNCESSDTPWFRILTTWRHHVVLHKGLNHKLEIQMYVGPSHYLAHISLAPYIGDDDKGKPVYSDQKEYHNITGAWDIVNGLIQLENFGAIRVAKRGQFNLDFLISENFKVQSLQGLVVYGGSRASSTHSIVYDYRRDFNRYPYMEKLKTVAAGFKGQVPSYKSDIVTTADGLWSYQIEFVFILGNSVVQYTTITHVPTGEVFKRTYMTGFKPLGGKILDLTCSKINWGSDNILYNFCSPYISADIWPHPLNSAYTEAHGYELGGHLPLTLKPSTRYYDLEETGYITKEELYDAIGL